MLCEVHFTIEQSSCLLAGTQRKCPYSRDYLAAPSDRHSDPRAEPAVCIILVSGVTDVSEKAKSLGLKFAIQKPFDPTMLLELIVKATS
jgi:hypothetical protein